MKHIVRTAGTLMASLVLATQAMAQDKPEQIDVGVFTFTSGAPAAYGQPGAQGAELMVDLINAAGGIDGVPLRATIVDEAQGAEGVIAEYRRLAGETSYQVMIAALSSSNCLALAPVAEQMQMPTISWNCDTHQLFLNQQLDYTFRPNGNTIPEFVAYVAYLLQVNPDIERVAIINPDYAFGHDAAEIVKAAFRAFKPDVEIVAELFPSLGASSYQTEVSRLSAARPDAIFSNLWGADLENFVRQAQPRGLLTQSQTVLALGETILQRIDLPDGVIVGMLGDGYWLTPDAQANEDTVAFAEEYATRFGEYPVFPTMKMANSFMVMKAAYEAAIEANDGEWPSRDEIAAALGGIETATFTGTARLREDNDGYVDQVIGVTGPSDTYDFSVITNMVRYDGEALMAPLGEDPIAWIETLTPEFLETLPEPGSYK
ncbi:MAG: ABC transporter substrate-binding protein [Devosia indica]|uniref:ABC transporter substrate-binding protein n=1 Tax=Devosia marina TaxID=2683198 RepID=A0A7X3FPM1_9HYPH|nr:ABC transporter substrate-binding protein [Devosia marina]MVS98448.1 ABC transporter substrate-binding protein [Devosia marina]